MRNAERVHGGAGQLSKEILARRTEWKRVKLGSHAIVYRTKVGGDSFVVKEIRKDFADEEQVRLLGADMVAYAEQLNAAGVPAPVPLETCPIRYEDDDALYLVTIDPDVGDDVETHIREGEEGNCLRIVRDMLEIVGELFRQTTPTGTSELVIGIDPKPANFVRDHSRAMSYVDLMPPRFRKLGRPIVEYPEPKSRRGFDLAYFRHYDQRGLLEVLRTQLCRLRPSCRREFVGAIQEFAGAFGPRLTDHLREFPGTLFSTAATRRREEIVVGLPDDAMYPVRDIACQLAFEHPDRCSDETLQTIFDLSHFHADTPDPDRMNKAKRMLLEIVVDHPSRTAL
ncbi:MAG: hypothetical protein PHI63_03890 [Patescibacteria group bacterium]|nr:hypothetical protein [Patescibacteria group bacterium]